MWWGGQEERRGWSWQRSRASFQKSLTGFVFSKLMISIANYRCGFRSRASFSFNCRPAWFGEMKRPLPGWVNSPGTCSPAHGITSLRLNLRRLAFQCLFFRGNSGYTFVAEEGMPLLPPASPTLLSALSLAAAGKWHPTQKVHHAV